MVVCINRRINVFGEKRTRKIGPRAAGKVSERFLSVCSTRHST